MALTIEEVRWVAHLARLELTEAELDLMARQLNNIIDYVNHLQQVDTDNVEPLAHPLPIQNVFREDQPRRRSPSRRRWPTLRTAVAISTGFPPCWTEPVTDAVGSRRCSLPTTAHGFRNTG